MSWWVVGRVLGARLIRFGVWMGLIWKHNVESEVKLYFLQGQTYCSQTSRWCQRYLLSTLIHQWLTAIILLSGEVLGVP